MLSPDDLVGTWHEYDGRSRRLATVTLDPGATWAMQPDLSRTAAKINYLLVMEPGGGRWILDTEVTPERRAKLIGKGQETPARLSNTLLILTTDRYVGGWGFQRVPAALAQQAVNQAVRAYPPWLRLGATAAHQGYRRKRPGEPYRAVFPKYEPIEVTAKRIEWWRWSVDETNGVLVEKEDRVWRKA